MFELQFKGYINTLIYELYQTAATFYILKANIFESCFFNFEYFFLIVTYVCYIQDYIQKKDFKVFSLITVNVLKSF